LSKGLAKLFITAAEGWSGTYRMRRLLSRGEWLLVDELEEPDLFLAALFLFMSCFALALPLLDLYAGESVFDDLVPPGPGADVLCVGGPLRFADPSRQDHAVAAGGARSQCRRGSRADRL
jgi:hypothetical protein